MECLHEKGKAMCIRLIQCVTYEKNCSYSPANTSRCPDLPWCATPRTTNKGKIKNPGFGFFVVLLMSTTLPAYPPLLPFPPHPAPQPPPKKTISWICQNSLTREHKIRVVWLVPGPDPEHSNTGGGYRMPKVWYKRREPQGGEYERGFPLS